MNTKQWDIYFCRIAREVSKNSKCMSRKIGTVLVKDKSIVSTGYNGPARGCKLCSERVFNHNDMKVENPKDCPRRLLGYHSGDGLHLCQAAHAERNALIQAAREGISTKGTTLYCFCGQPCKDCCIEIINAGVSEIVCFAEEKHYDEYSTILLEESGIKVRTIKKEEL